MVGEYIHLDTRKGPAGKVKTGPILALSAIYEVLLWEIRLKKNDAHKKKGVKQEGQANNKKTKDC